MTPEFTSFANGRYQVVRKLGEGGKGVVFLCQDTALSRQVAVKVIKEEVLDPEGLLRFQREVQAMGRLLHPHVVTVFDIGNEAGKHFVVLEFMEGGDLEQLIESAVQKRLDAATAARIGKDVTQALEHAHGHGILHRDIKPANIWLTKEVQAKLGDFGLAYLGGSLRITQAGMMVGSVAYMAPEVALGKQADHRSDLYMLGGDSL
jgi:serine/threonine protein kinase